MPTGFKIADAYVSVRLDKDQLRSDMAALPGDLNSDVDRAGKDVGSRLGKGVSDGTDAKTVGKKIASDVGSGAAPEADKQGRNTGDKISKGMEQSILARNPMITAAIAGGLIAGAPALLGAAGALFVGIAAAAVHSNQQVQQAFATTKDSITSTFTNAAQVAVPFFVSALQRIGSAVQGLSPQMHTAFAALGAPIDSLTTGLISLMNNVMPGLVAAVRNAGPVFQGLASLMGSIGTGIGQMFQILSEHSTAAGTVLSSLGSILGSLLPILGQLVGAGVELASQVLPPVAAALHLVADALNFIAPVLPTVLAGFLAFKAVGLLSGPLGTLSAKLQTVAADAEGMGGKLAGVGASGVSKIAGALPALGVAVGIVGAAWEAQSQQINTWAKALLDGGAAADQATAQMKQQSAAVGQLNSGVEGFLGHLTGYGAAMDATSQSQAKAKQSAQDLYNAMSPLQQKQQDVTKATNELQQAIAKWGPNSGQAAGASVELKDKQDALARAQSQLEQATHGVTQAILDQANQALAAADSGLAYRQSQSQAATAAAEFAKALREHKAALNDNSDASLAYEEALLRQANAAGKAAADQSGLTDKMQLQKVADQATLQELYRLRDEYGANFPASLQATIARLEKTGIALDDVGAKKPQPTVTVNDQTPGPVKAIHDSLVGLNAQRPTPIAALTTGPLQVATAQALAGLAALNGQRPAPVASLNTGPFSGGANFISGTMGWLNGLRSYPWATLLANTAGAENAINWAARTRTAVINVVQRIGSIGFGFGAATGGQVGAVVGAAAKRFDVGGRISGPGGGTDDLVPAITAAGMPLRVSNREWIVTERAADHYGDVKMAAINAGTATVLLPSRSQGMASGGSASSSTGSSGAGITVQNLTVAVSGTLDFSDPSEIRKVAVGIRDALVRLEREQR